MYKIIDGEMFLYILWKKNQILRFTIEIKIKKKKRKLNSNMMFFRIRGYWWFYCCYSSISGIVIEHNKEKEVIWLLSLQYLNSKFILEHILLKKCLKSEEHISFAEHSVFFLKKKKYIKWCSTHLLKIEVIILCYNLSTVIFFLQKQEPTVGKCSTVSREVIPLTVHGC